MTMFQRLMTASTALVIVVTTWNYEVRASRIFSKRSGHKKIFYKVFKEMFLLRQVKKQKQRRGRISGIPFSLEDASEARFMPFNLNLLQTILATKKWCKEGTPKLWTFFDETFCVNFFNIRSISKTRKELHFLSLLFSFFRRIKSLFILDLEVPDNFF